jgi:hypothetical protein
MSNSSQSSLPSLENYPIQSSATLVNGTSSSPDSILATPPSSPQSPLYSPVEYFTAEEDSDIEVSSDDEISEQEVISENSEHARVVGLFQQYIFLRQKYIHAYPYHPEQTFATPNCRINQADRCIHSIPRIQFISEEIRVPDILNLRIVTFLAGILEIHCVDEDVIQTLHQIGIPFCDSDYQIWKHLLIEFRLEEAAHWEHLITQLHDHQHPYHSRDHPYYRQDQDHTNQVGLLNQLNPSLYRDQVNQVRVQATIPVQTFNRESTLERNQRVWRALIGRVAFLQQQQQQELDSTRQD